MALYERIVGISIVLFSLSLWAEQGNVPGVPHYQEVLDAQLACDKKAFERIHWDPEREIHLAPKAWSVIADLSVKETEALKQNEKQGPNRRFEVSFRGMGYFECGEPVQGLDAPEGRTIVRHPFLQHAYKKLQYVEEFSDDPDDAYAEGWPLFLSNVATTDRPASKDAMGRVCLVKLETLLKNSNAIDLNKLCSGESKQKREQTRKEILRAISVWKK